MGTCFSSCRGRIMRKSSHKSSFLINESADEATCDNEEFLELEQRCEVKTHAQKTGKQAPEATKPNRLTFKRPNFNWLKPDNHLLPGPIHRISMKSPADSVMPLLNKDSSFAESCSFSGSQKWDQLSNGATPNSSVDLEWENEIGFSSENFGATEEMQWTVLTENTNNSYRSTPISNSNGLEWDGDFTSIDITDLVTETQKLTADLEEIEPDNCKSLFRDLENNN